jgi:ATP-dependent Clp protease ATP-binding subunit ClpC
MAFNFETRSTIVSQSLKISSFILFKYAQLLAQVFFYLSILSLSLPAFAFLEVISPSLALEIPIFFFILFLLWLQVYLFIETKIKKPKASVSLSSAITSPSNYNLAECLDLATCQIVESAIRVCKKRRLAEVSSTALLYASVLENSDIQLLIMRLGIDVMKLKMDLKNYLEKQLKQEKYKLLLSSSFEVTMMEAGHVALVRKANTISEKDLLVALTRHDEFFKNVLVEHDLKEADVCNVTLWLTLLEERVNQEKQFWTKENLLRLGSLGRDLSSGFTITLDRFSVNLTQVAGRNIFGEIIGHEKEVDELERILTKPSLSNALIVGEVGMGRKSIVEALAQRCFLGNHLPELNNKKIVQLDMVSLLTQIQDPEKLEATLDQIFQEVISAGNIILFIDNLDNFATQKDQKLGSADITSILGKYLPLPGFQFIGITSYDGLHQKLERNNAFLEYFTKVEVSETTELETLRILQNTALGLEAKYQLVILYPAIREIINLSARYFPSMPFPKKAIDILQEVASYVRGKKEKLVLPSHVDKVVSDKTQIPVGKMEFKEKEVLLNLENLIHERIINQKEAVDEISVAMRRARSGLGSKKRPMGTFLFLGPTGVGKTETAKALAQIYFGSEDKMIRLDMSEFQQISDIPRLLGAVSPVEQQGLLTTPVRENPFSLVLLDEIEKAHPNILNLFLQVFDEGNITDGQGRKIIFSNTIIICTSNAGANMIFKEVEAGNKIKKDSLFEFLFQEKIFRPEFINRFDAAVFFSPLTKENLMDIAQLMLGSLAKNLEEKEIHLTITNALKESIVNLSYKPEFGAREMRRVVQDKIENTIAQALLSDTIVKGDTIEINPETFEIIKK